MRQRDRAQQREPPDVRGDHDRPPSQPVHPDAHERPGQNAGTSSAAENIAICSGPASSTRIAVNGNAVRPTSDPKIEIVSPVQSLTKLGLRQSEGDEFRI